ncbi:hypothetical protein LB579_32110, partial [Mesorhizobium sp. BR1-1-7]|uniref:hypothetical protein n=1 Tax=Mesorhizobium sp. BR1-1-7 TaxID=2876647 RepID=UPI001CCC7845
MVKYTEASLRSGLLRAGLDQTRAHEVEALMHVFHSGARRLGKSSCLTHLSNFPPGCAARHSIKTASDYH